MPYKVSKELEMLRMFMIAAGVSAMLGASGVQAREEADIVELLARDAERSSSVARELAPLKSSTDVYMYIQNTPSELSAFTGMSAFDRDQFVSSLKFNEKGLTEFDTRPLKKLSPSQVYRVLALFGMQNSAGLIKSPARTEIDKEAATTPTMLPPDFLEDYRCESRATCAQSVHRACTSNC